MQKRAQTCDGANQEGEEENGMNALNGRNERRWFGNGGHGDRSGRGYVKAHCVRSIEAVGERSWTRGIFRRTLRVGHAPPHPKAESTSGNKGLISYSSSR